MYSSAVQQPGYQGVYIMQILGILGEEEIQTIQPSNKIIIMRPNNTCNSSAISSFKTNIAQDM